MAPEAIEAKLVPVAWTAMMADEAAALGRLPEPWVGGPGQKVPTGGGGCCNGIANTNLDSCNSLPPRRLRWGPTTAERDGDKGAPRGERRTVADLR